MSERRRGLATKFNLLAIALIAMTSAGTALVITRQVTATRYQDLLEHGLQDAAAAARSSEYAVYTENQDALQRILTPLTQMANVAYAEILAKDGKILAATVVDPAVDIPAELPTLVDGHNPRLLSREFRLPELGWAYFDILAPITSAAAADDPELILELAEEPSERSVIGYVHLGVSQRSLRSSTLQLLLSAGAVTSLIICFGVAITVLMIRRITSPLRSLLQVTQEIADGNLDLEIDIHTGDELGELAASIDSIVKRLAASRSELEAHQRTLESRVKERTQELSAATEHAVQLAREAQQASLAKSRFLAIMSHEIRTPMTAILGFTDLLRDRDQSEADKLAHIETVSRNGNHLLAIINDILDLSKIEAEQMDVELAPCSPIEVVEDVLELMRDRAVEKGLRLSVDYEFPLPSQILSSALRLRQILVNLIGNAVKFTETGSVSIRLSCDPERGKPLLSFEVRDTGIGISDDALTKIFEPFVQVDASMTRRFSGTGLGLAISKRLAILLGGEIYVDSEVGEGSILTVTVATGPLEKDSLLTSSAQLSDSRARTRVRQVAVRAQLRGRVLLAEDGIDNQKLILLHLRRAGLRVEAAENGRVAVELALAASRDGTPFDVILMDMQMPVMDGYEATARLREQDYKAAIIALTAHAMPDDRKECLEIGCDEYATKPIDPEKLLALIATYL